METLDLDINNYELHDILALFKLDKDFSESDLKKAKQLVLKMHPDKSKMDPKFFLFFSKAYKTLYSIYNFKNKSMNKSETDYETIVGNEEKNAVLHDFFESNKKLQQPRHFNRWFNEQFEKNRIVTETETKGYGDWLKSEEDIETENTQINEKICIRFLKRKNANYEH